MLDIDEIKNDNVQEWVIKNLKEWEEITKYPGRTIAQYDWWMNFIYRIIWAHQSDKEIKDMLNSQNLNNGCGTIARLPNGWGVSCGEMTGKHQYLCSNCSDKVKSTNEVKDD